MHLADLLFTRRRWRDVSAFFVNEESIAAEAALEIGSQTLDFKQACSLCCTASRSWKFESLRPPRLRPENHGATSDAATLRIAAPLLAAVPIAAASREVAWPISDRGPTLRVIQITRVRPGNRSTELAAAPVKPLSQRSKVRLYARPDLDYCDLSHIARFEPVLSLQHPNVMHASFAGR
jgi:hypothetical protein